MYSLSTYILLLLFIHKQVLTANSLSPTYQRLAALYCYIDDYTNWLEQQTSLNYFLQYAHFFDLDKKRIERIFERYRLQHECLRALERLPIIVGNG
jgi:hypothetical protein